MNPALTVYHHSVFDFINKDFLIETLADDCLFTEGPVWNKEGYYLFSDTTANVIYKIIPGKEKEIFLGRAGTNNPEDADLKPRWVGGSFPASPVGGCNSRNQGLRRQRVC